MMNTSAACSPRLIPFSPSCRGLRAHFSYVTRKSCFLAIYRLVGPQATKQPVGVLHETSATHLHKPENPLEHQNRMLHFASDLVRFLDRSPPLTGCLLLDEAHGTRCVSTYYVALPAVSRIAPYTRFMVL